MCLNFLFSYRDRRLVKRHQRHAKHVNIPSIINQSVRCVCAILIQKIILMENHVQIDPFLKIICIHIFANECMRLYTLKKGLKILIKWFWRIFFPKQLIISKHAQYTKYFWEKNHLKLFIKGFASVSFLSNTKVIGYRIRIFNTFSRWSWYRGFKRFITEYFELL